MANKRTAAIEAGFDYQYFWFWDYAVRMLPFNSNIKSVEFESSDASPFDDVVINYWDNISCAPPIVKCNRDFLQCKFKVRQEKSLKWNDLLNPDYYGNKESLLVRAYKFYKNEIQKDINFRLILCTSIDFANDDLLRKYILSYERELDIDALFKSTETFDLRAEIKKHISQNIADTKEMSDEEIKSFLSHFRFYTAEWFDKVVSNFKFNCDKAKVDFDRSKLSEPFTSLIKTLNRQGRTTFNRQDIVDICKNEKLITDDLDYVIYDSDYFNLKEQWNELKIQWEKDKNNIDTYNNYAPIAEQYDLLQKQKETTISQLRSLVKIINVDGLTVPQGRAVRLAKEGQWEEFAIVFSNSEIQKEILEKSKEEKNTLNVLNDNLKIGWENRLNVLRLNITFTNNKADLETVKQLYIEAVQYAKEYDLSKDIIFDYAKFLRQIHQNENALKVAKEYLSYKNEQAQLIRLEALSFTQLLLAKLEKEYSKILNVWKEAINEWDKLIKTEGSISGALDLDKDILLKFQEFVRNSGDFILSNKNFRGEEECLYNGGVQEYFLKLHELCESTMKQYDISLAIPENVDGAYKQYIQDRIYASEQKKPPVTEEEIQQAIEETQLQPTRPKFVTMQAITPFNQAEELFVYAYSISKSLVDVYPNNYNCLFQLARNCDTIASLNINIVPLTTFEIFNNTINLYERLNENKNLDVRLSIILCKQNMAQALISQDIKTNSEGNKERIEELHTEATKAMEELYALNPQVYYVNLTQSYMMEAERCKHYADMHGEISKGEFDFLIKLLQFLNNIKINNGDISTERALVDTLNRYIWISKFFLNEKAYIKYADLNFNELIERCKIISKKYPANFRVRLYDAYINYGQYLIFEKGEVEKSVKQFEKGFDIFIEMIKNDDKDIFSAAKWLFSFLFNEKSGLYQNEALKQYVLRFHQIEQEFLLRLFTFYQHGIPAITLIPKNERYGRYGQSDFSILMSTRQKEQFEKDREFYNSFSTILYRAFCRLIEIMQSIGDFNVLLSIANNVVKLYLELMCQGVNGYTRKETKDDNSKKTAKSKKYLNITIQQNSLSYQILNREFRSIREMFLEINGGGIVVANVCIDYISKFLNDYKQQIADGWSLTKEYEEYIVDKCNCLAHTIGQMYVEEDETEIEALFTTAFKLQEQLGEINPVCFAVIMIEYFRYKMLKYMQQEPIDNKTKIAHWKTVLEYVSICEKCKIYNDSLKRILKSMKVLSDENSDNIEEISEAINTVKKIIGQMIDSLENNH